MSRSIRLYVALGAAALVLLGAGVFAAVKLISSSIDGAIPHADLFGAGGPAVTPTPTVAPTPTGPPPGADIKGPLNFLIVGVDTRTSIAGWVPHGDAVMIMHVGADLSTAYLTSLPRDLVVDIPAFAPAKFGGAHTKLTHAMSYGANVPGSKTPNTAQGFQLMARTVSAYTGIAQFDGGALLNFGGLKSVVDAIGGIAINVDQPVVSIHIQPNGLHRPACGGCAHGYSGPQATYNVGMQNFVGWQALDYSRQRYIAGGDYARGRHQRQVVKAIIAKAFLSESLSGPAAIAKLVQALGDSIVFDGRGRQPSEFAYALRNIKAEKVSLVGLPGNGAYSGGAYIGESLGGIQSSYFAALRQDNLAAFLAGNPSLVHA
ncbi:MAG: polyisoprenyl-teichoic acid--peptidoglycan teichoic acid transferase [Micromonosporaceae bacterium]|nr:polyisoprenyl-teichoic acid--peptidoglycan teichoic acid transferase [Micromonosporaceae bacterium]